MNKLSFETNRVAFVFRLIDFQIPFYNSYAYDITYFLSTSAKVEVWERRDEVLATYQKTLSSTFAKLGFECPEVPDLQEVKGEVDRFLYFSTILLASCVSFMMTEPENTMEMEDVLSDYTEKKEVKLNKAPFRGKAYTFKLKHLLKYYHEKGAFN